MFAEMWRCKKPPSIVRVSNIKVSMDDLKGTMSAPVEGHLGCDDQDGCLKIEESYPGGYH